MRYGQNMGRVRALSEVSIKTNPIRGDTNISPYFSNTYKILLGLREVRGWLNDLPPNY